MPQPIPHIHQAVDHLFRHESGKMIAVLTKLLGLQHLELAQDIVQDSLLQAMNVWSYKGLPDNPAAWLYRVARNKAIDYLRREKNWSAISSQYAYLLEADHSETTDSLFEAQAIEDSMLLMLFACCHPSISSEAQLALALKTLCGLTNAEIARAFLTQEDTIAKRIYRAREKMRAENVQLVLPSTAQLQARLHIVLHCLYLLFNEGYFATHPDRLIREELCEEAIRLTYLLTQHPLTAVPRTHALLALLCFQASRLPTRLDDQGNIILLQQQNRSLWYRPLINKGFEYLELAAEPFELSPYHIEAGIASLHAAAPSFEQTDWPTIYKLYETLSVLQPGPVVLLNKAIAAAYAIHPSEALSQLQSIKGLEEFCLYHTAMGEMHFLLQQKDAALHYYQQALQLAASRPEQQLLQSKIHLC
ncbi:MAG TPA: sigma-70 family RNA polymerase sigma factor [Flavisolibacter sp.]|nr:sigma-70 family RNA polymerase sigma factor [Flavisolibacter sp.]